MERRFVITNVTDHLEDKYGLLYADIEKIAITEAELKRRLLILMDIESCNNWPKAIDILINGEKEQAEYCVCGKPIGHREPCPPDGEPPDDEWERWVERMPVNWVAAEVWKDWFREMPPRGK